MRSCEISRRLMELKAKYPGFVAMPGFIERISEVSDGSGSIYPCYAGKNLFNIDCRGEVTRCIDRLDDPAGNIMTDDMDALQERLLDQFESGDCGDCWTSCRGNVESLLYGRGRLRNLVSYYRLIRRVPLARAGECGGC